MSESLNLQQLKDLKEVARQLGATGMTTSGAVTDTNVTSLSLPAGTNLNVGASVDLTCGTGQFSGTGSLSNDSYFAVQMEVDADMGQGPYKTWIMDAEGNGGGDWQTGVFEPVEIANGNTNGISSYYSAGTIVYKKNSDDYGGWSGGNMFVWFRPDTAAKRGTWPWDRHVEDIGFWCLSHTNPNHTYTYMMWPGRGSNSYTPADDFNYFKTAYANIGSQTENYTGELMTRWDYYYNAGNWVNDNNIDSKYQYYGDMQNNEDYTGTVNNHNSNEMYIGQGHNADSGVLQKDLGVPVNSYSIGAAGNIISQGSVLSVSSLNYSDARIKENIEDVPDNLALESIRKIPCRYYKYIDKHTRGHGKTIGFIAQEVREELPMAVLKSRGVIPDHYREGEVIWETINDKHFMTVSNLNDNVFPGSIIKFICTKKSTNNLSITVECEVPLNNEHKFEMKQEYDRVFIYGMQVEKLAVDKAKIFALHHSAIQELDRVVEAQKATIAALEQKNAAQESALAALEQKNAAQESALAALLARVEALEGN